MKKIFLILLTIALTTHSFGQFILWDASPGYHAIFRGTGTDGAPSTSDGALGFLITGAGCAITENGTVASMTMYSGSSLTITNGFTLTINASVIVNSGATLTISSGGTLVVTDDISNSGTIVVNDGGNLIQTGSGFASGSGYQVSQSGYASTTRYNFWSSPVNGANLPSVFSGANGCDFYYYNSANAEFRRLSAYSTCVPAVTADGSSTMGNGVGYSVAGGGSPTFSGTINTGSVTNNTVSSGWNLVGNPYPSSITGSLFLDVNTNTTGTLYFWSDDGSAGAGYDETRDYATWNSGGGTGATGGGASTVPNGSIAIAQGFFVNVTSGSSVSFTNAMRDGSNNSQFFKTNDDIQRAWISAMAPEHSSQILFAFTENATEGKDWSYDSKRFSTGDDFAFGSILEGEMEPYAIQSFSDEDLETEREIPLTIFSKTSGVTSFQLDKTENLDTNVVITIIDNSTGKEQQLDQGPYAVYLNANQLYDSRFTIKFRNTTAPPDPVGVESLKKSYLNLNYTDNNLFINNVIPMERINIISLTGSVIYSEELYSSFESTIALNNLSPGVYIARILNEDGSIESKKFVIQ